MIFLLPWGPGVCLVYPSCSVLIFFSGWSPSWRPFDRHYLIAVFGHGGMALQAWQPPALVFDGERRSKSCSG
ncbi:hypothetical protein N658DRAFT_296002 [Parathielavia hyrcaniae]|uniref:Uncharacterized protein n=1 Tax=Parathielavia hyrcaniae TaxID=113614 RepID=A0AAN6PWA6_9PEZI|nr:hypothetical protein N658DRAFT_296002 [Parathielavia hyrcaniae]